MSEPGKPEPAYNNVHQFPITVGRPRVMMAEQEGLITYAIGDVHGCRDKLIRLLYFCARHRAGRPARYVFIGDYIDRGPDSRGVIDILIKMQQDMPGWVICLRGNHEVLMLNAMGWQEDQGLLWVSQGGARTLLSYGVKQPAELPAKHLSWIASLPLCFDDGRRLFAHAGVNPSMPLDQQAEVDLVWIREPFLSSEQDYGRLIVHGHAPLRSAVPELRPNRLNLDTGAVYGGPLTAAVFDDEHISPIAFINDVDGICPIE